MKPQRQIYDEVHSATMFTISLILIAVAGIVGFAWWAVETGSGEMERNLRNEPNAGQVSTE